MLDKDTIFKISQNKIGNTFGIPFQELCDRLLSTLYPNDYVPVRAAGRYGDGKNDGYCPEARIFFQAHSSMGVDISTITSKIEEDLNGCLQIHREVKEWVFLTNYTQRADVEHFIDELRPKYPHLKLNTWDNLKLAQKIRELPIEDVNHILGMNLGEFIQIQKDKPTLDVVDGFLQNGGPSGTFNLFTIQNIGKSPAINCEIKIVGDDYEWLVPFVKKNMTLTPGEKVKDISFRLDTDKLGKEIVNNLKVEMSCIDENGTNYTTFREVIQKDKRADHILTLELGKFIPSTILHEDYMKVESNTDAPTTRNNNGNTLTRFEYLLEHSRWTKEFIDENEFWICDDDVLFQIESCGDNHKFTEPWTQVYPDKEGSGRYSVNLNISGVTIRQIPFIYCDGGRISVPMPERRVENENIVYFWKRSSIEYKLANVIGSFYIYDNIEGIAKMSKIEIID